LFQQIGREETDERRLLQTERVRAIIYGWRQCKESPLSVRDILAKLDDYISYGVYPDIKTYNIIMEAILHKEGPSAVATLIDVIFERIERESQNPHADVSLSAVSYTTAIHALCESGTPERAEDLLMNMGVAYKANKLDRPPTASQYTLVLSAWTKHQSGAPQRAEALLQRMRDSDIPGIQPTKYHFNAVLDTWAKSDDAKAPERAYAVLREMEKLHSAGNVEVKADCWSYSAVIAAYARCDKAADAEAVLLQLLDRYTATQDPDYAPGEIPFRSVIVALSKSGHKDAPRRAEAMLERALSVGISSNAMFRAAIEAWSKSGNSIAPERVEAILKTMEDLYATSGVVKADTPIYTAVVDCFVRAGGIQNARRAEALLDMMLVKFDQTGDQDYLPQSRTFKLVLNAFTKSKHKQITSISMEFLAKMEDLYKGGLDAAKPTEYSYYNVIDCWANSGLPDAEKHAEALLDKLIAEYMRTGDPDLKPNQALFSLVIKAIANSREGNIVEKAKGLLSEMRERFRLEPDLLVYNNVLYAFSKQSDAAVVKQALEILQEMKRKEIDGYSNAVPDAFTYSVILRIVANARDCRGRAILAKELLAEMEGRSLQPAMTNLSTVLLACCHLPPEPEFDIERQGAFKVAQQTFKRILKEYDPPDAFAFANFILACTHNDMRLAKAVYDKACEFGYGDEKEVLRAVRLSRLKG